MSTFQDLSCQVSPISDLAFQTITLPGIKPYGRSAITKKDGRKEGRGRRRGRAREGKGTAVTITGSYQPQLESPGWEASCGISTKRGSVYAPPPGMFLQQGLCLLPSVICLVVCCYLHRCSIMFCIWLSQGKPFPFHFWEKCNCLCKEEEKTSSVCNFYVDNWGWETVCVCMRKREKERDLGGRGERCLARRLSTPVLPITLFNFI